MKRPRKARVFDAEGNALGGWWEDINTTDVYGNPAYLTLYPPQLTADPNINKMVVPAGTAPTDYVLAVSKNFPDSASDTWYIQSVLSGAVTQPAATVRAAVETLQSTGAEITAAGAQVLGVASTLTQNLPLILLGLGALYLFLNYGGQHHGES